MSHDIEPTSLAHDPVAAPAAPARLVVFTRFPEPGTTKTRLIGRLGADGAAELQREMTRHTLDSARALRRRRGVAVEVRFVGGDAASMGACFGGDLVYLPQGDGDLGRRMARAVAEALRDGVASVVLIGSDCPGVTTDLLARAFDLLGEDPAGAVVGPALDGGYYLIGLRRERPELFRGIAWGTAGVLAQTTEVARRRGILLRLLEPLADVDRPEDLDVWYAARGRPTAD